MRLSGMCDLSLLEYIHLVTKFLGTWWRLDTNSCLEKTGEGLGKEHLENKWIKCW